MLLVDTNVLLDVLQDDPRWAEWSIEQLRAQAQGHELYINPIIYAELSLTFQSVETLDAAVAEMELTSRELPKPALFLAARAFIQYRRRDRQKNNVLSDFLIGAHAAVLGCGILTRDGGRYRNYFPSGALIIPDDA